MFSNNKIYRAVSTAVFIIHALLFLFIIAATFFEFMNGENYYAAFRGFLYEKLQALQPFLILLVALLFTACAFFAVRRPLFGAGTLVGSFSFFFLVMLKPITVLGAYETASPFSQSEIGGNVLGTGFYMLSYASDVIYLDAAFCVFSLISFIISKRRSNDG